MATLEASTELAAPQWADSPKLRGSVQVFLDRLEQDVLDAVDELALMMEIDSAQGVWLDYLGVKYGVDRPSTRSQAQDDRFGFDEAGQAFDQVPFRGDTENDAVFPLGDEVYRRFVKARAILVTGDGTFATFVRAVREIDPTASLRDLRIMTIRVLTDYPDLLQLADDSGALPRNGGVKLAFASLSAFGFDEAGRAFDQAPFRAG